jgi:hypothetical protein
VEVLQEPDGAEDADGEPSTRDEEASEERDAGAEAAGTDGATQAPAPVPVPPLAPARRRGRRTALLIAGAAVLGIVAGTCTGYVVQAGRTPTTLPSLSQPALSRAGGPAPEPLSAAQDRQVKTDGDLRKLLVPRPKGARDAVFVPGMDGWVSIGEEAESFKDSAGAFEDLVSDEFRRAAGTAWRVGGTYTVEIRLAQYRQEERVAASDWASGQVYWAEKEPDTESWPISGTGDGMAYVHHNTDVEPGYLDIYHAEAIAWRGDLVMEIWITDTKQIPKKDIVDLAEQQMERL